MKTLGRNSSNDLYLEAGGLAILSDADAQCAVIESIIQTQQGELQFDEEAGIDYFGTVLQNPSYIPLWAAQVKSKIEALDFVSSVEDFTYRFDRESSTLFWSMTVVNTDDERLDLTNKKTAMGTSPAMDVGWDNIYAKPSGVESVSTMLEAMTAEAESVEELKKSDSRTKVKGVIDSLIFDPNDDTYAASRLLKFKLVGVPLGSTIDVSNLKITSASSWLVDFGDGNTLKMASSDTSISEPSHAFDVGGDIVMSIRGDIMSIETNGKVGTDADSTPLPVFLDSAGNPYQNIVSFEIGSRVPLTGGTFTVGDNVFRRLRNLQDFTWNSSVPVSFGSYAFAGCQSILKLGWLPKKLTSLGEGCFSGCTALVDLSGMPDTDETITEIPARCFECCTALTSIAGLPSRISSIGDYAFKGCAGLESIDGISNVAADSFGNGCFEGCTGITATLYWPSKIANIGERCFADNTSLVSVWLPDTITSIGAEAFSGCTALDNVMVEAVKPPTLGSNAFTQDIDTLKIFCPGDSLSVYKEASGWSSREANIFAYGVHKFTLSAMSSGTALASGTSSVGSESVWTVDFGDGTGETRLVKTETGIPSHTYSTATTGDTVITLKGYVKELSAVSESLSPIFATSPGSTFSYLTKVELKDSPLEVIGDYAFANCTSLSSVSLGFADGHGYRLGDRAFYNCTSLLSLDWLTFGLGMLLDSEGEYYDAFGDGCFYGAGLTSLGYAMDGVRSISENCFHGTSLSTLDGIGNDNLTTLGESCFSSIPTLSSIKALSSTGVTELPANCFLGSISVSGVLANVTLSGIEKITTLGDSCFSGCSNLSSIAELKNSEITSLPYHCFYGCSNLASLDGVQKIADTDDNDALGEGCFQNCTALSNIRAISESGILDIPAYCFSGCTAIVSLVGLDKVRSIGGYSFYGCTSLRGVSGLGSPDTTVGQLDSIGAYAFSGCSALEWVSLPMRDVPSLDSTSFDLTTFKSVPLFVREGMETAFKDSTTQWSNFSSISSRTFRVTLGISADGSVLNGENSVVSADYVWYVSYGDDSQPTTIYVEDGVASIPNHTYSSVGSYSLTIFGDVSGIASKEEKKPAFKLLNGSLDYTRSGINSVYVSSQWMKEIGAYTFYKCNKISSLEIQSTGGCSIVDACFAGCSEMSVTSGSAPSITSIGESAFLDCAGITDCSAFSSASKIGAYAFSGCFGITSTSAFVACEEIGEYAFYTCYGLTRVDGLSSVKTIGKNAFAQCHGITIVSGFGSNIESFGDCAFQGCPDIKTVFIAVNTPPSLPANAFDDEVFNTAELYVPVGAVDAYKAADYWNKFKAENIKVRFISFTLEGVRSGLKLAGGLTTVTSTGAWSISYGDGESSFTYSGSQTLGEYTFSGSGTKVIQLSGAITGISAASTDAYPVFGTAAKSANTYLTGVESTSALEITSFGPYTFKGCSSLKSVKSATTVTSVGIECFANCTSLTDLSGLSGVETVSESAFSGCSSLKGLYGLHSVKTVGGYAFKGCTSLQTIDGLGMGVESIGGYAFSKCTGLKEVQMFAVTPPTIATTAFDGVSVSSIPLYVLSRHVSDYNGKAVWSSFSTVTYRAVELTLKGVVQDGVVYGDTSKVKSPTYWAVDWDDESEIVGTPSCDGIETSVVTHKYSDPGDYVVKVEGAVKSIGGSYSATGGSGSDVKVTASPFLTFSDESDWLTTIGTSDSAVLEEAGDAAFYGCKSLATVYLPTVTKLGGFSFARCAALPSLSGFPLVASVGEYAFFECPGISIVDGFGPELSSIGQYAFGGEGVSIEYIQTSADTPPSIVGTSFGNLTDEQKAAMSVYVPLSSVLDYQSDSEWNKFNIGSRVIKFTMTAVPAGTKIISGTSRVISNSAWAVDWGDGRSTSIDNMSKEETTFPSHTFEKLSTDAVAYSSTDTAGKWYPVDATGAFVSASSATFDHYAKDFVVSISGNIQSIAARSAESYPFFATAAAAAFPYLTKIESSNGMAEFTTIGDYAFRGNTGLTTINGCVNLTSIKSYAFYGCSSLVDCGDSDSSGFLKLTAVEDYAFANCTRLSSLNGFPKVTMLDDYAFYGCSKLYSIDKLGSRLYEGVSHDDQVKITSSFGAYCFGGCSLRDITTNYVVPPVITATTFSGTDTATTAVYVPNYTNPSWSQGSSVNAYMTAQYWRDYWRNIDVASTISFAIDGLAGNTLTGKGKVTTSSGAAWTVDWGDGSDTESVSGTTMPSHTYGADAPTTVTVKLRGSIVKIAGAVNLYEDQVDSVTFRGITTTQIYHDKPLSDLIIDGETYSSSKQKPGDLFVYKTTGEIREYVVIGLKYQLVELNPLFSLSSSATLAGFSVDDEANLETIGEACFAGHKSLKSLTVSCATLRGIERYAFHNCSGMESLYITSKAGETETAIETNIGIAAFAGCSALRTMQVSSEGTIKIAERAFLLSDLSSADGLVLKGVVDSIGDYAFLGCTNLGKVSIQNLEGVDEPANGPLTIGAHSFNGCYQLSSVSFIGSRATSIGEYAFYKCYGLTAPIPLPDTMVTIDNYAFYGCTKLDGEQVVPSSLLSLGKSAFESCVGLDVLTWKEAEEGSTSSASIGARAFYGCAGLQTAKIASQVNAIGTEAFRECSNLQKVSWTASDAKSTIGDYCFMDCSKLLSVDSFQNVAVLSYSAFRNCSQLQKLDFLSSDLTTIGDYCFDGCGLQSSDVDLKGTSLAQIGKYAFRGCNFKTFTLPSTVTSIGERAFYDCESLQTFSWETGTSVATIGAWCFAECTDLGTIPSFGRVAQIPSHCFFRCGGLQTGVGNVLQYATGTVSEYAFASCGKIADVSLPLGVSGVGEGCFCCSDCLQKGYKADETFEGFDFDDMDDAIAAAATDTRVSIMDTAKHGLQSLTWVGGTGDSYSYSTGKYAFMNCTRLDSISIPSRTKTISDYAFYNCKALNDISKLSLSVLNYLGKESFAYTGIGFMASNFGSPTTMGTGVFKYCTNLTSIENAPNVDKFPDETFMGCSSLQTIKGIPTSVRTLGDWCFAYTGLVSTEAENITNYSDWITTIGTGCFAYCTKIDTLDGMQTVTTIPFKAFYGCTSLAYINRLWHIGFERTHEDDSARSNQENITKVSTVDIVFTPKSIGLASGWNITTLALKSRPSSSPGTYPTQAKNFGPIYLKCAIQNSKGVNIIESRETIISTGDTMEYENFKNFQFIFDIDKYAGVVMEENDIYHFFITCRYEGGGGGSGFDSHVFLGLSYALNASTGGYPYMVSPIWNNFKPIVRVGAKYVGKGMLVAESFGGCPGIQNVKLPYTSVVETKTASETVGGVSTVYKDPFSAIPLNAETGKKDANLLVPEGMVDLYKSTASSNYWQVFNNIEAIADDTPAGDSTAGDSTAGDSTSGDSTAGDSKV